MVEADRAAVVDLISEVIIQGVNDYRTLKAEQMIRYGRPDYMVINQTHSMPRNINAGEVEAVCEFIWGGWMARLIGVAGLRVSPDPIYQLLEPKLWRILISKHQTESATSR